jgi:hypothetical protein
VLPPSTPDAQSIIGSLPTPQLAWLQAEAIRESRHEYLTASGSASRAGGSGVRLAREIAALSVAGNSSFSSLVDLRFSALQSFTASIELETRKARAGEVSRSLGGGAASAAAGGASGSDAAAGGTTPASIGAATWTALLSALLELTARHDSALCERLLRQLAAVVCSVAPGALATASITGDAASTRALVARAAAAVGVAMPTPGANVSLGELQQFAVRCAASSESVLPMSVRGLAAEVHQRTAARALAVPASGSHVCVCVRCIAGGVSTRGGARLRDRHAAGALLAADRPNAVDDACACGICGCDTVSAPRASTMAFSWR